MPLATVLADEGEVSLARTVGQRRVDVLLHDEAVFSVSLAVVGLVGRPVVGRNSRVGAVLAAVDPRPVPLRALVRPAHPHVSVACRRKAKGSRVFEGCS